MFLQQAGIPDNVNFLVLGMAVLFVMFGGWVASLYWRARNLRRNLDLLRQQDTEQ